MEKQPTIVLTPQEIFNEDCTQGVELVVKTIRGLRASGPLDFSTVKEALVELDEQLAKIRNNTAIKTNTHNAELFGRSRKNSPVYKDGKVVTDISRIFNPQHKAVHQRVKALLRNYIKSTMCEERKQKFGYEGISYDNIDKPNSRYVIRVYTQTHITFQPIDETQPSIDIPIDGNLSELVALSKDPTYRASPQYNCDNDIRLLFGQMTSEHLSYLKKNILVGEIQVKVGEEFIPATRHVTWLHNTINEFDKESAVYLYHMMTKHHEAMFNKVAEQWFAAIGWKEGKDDPEILNKIMADLQFYYSQPLFRYRGSPTISKMLSKGTYYEQGFLPRPTVSEIDEYCTAEYFPFMQQHRKKFTECFAAPPTSERTREFTLKQGRFAVNENDALQSTTSSPAEDQISQSM